MPIIEDLDNITLKQCDAISKSLKDDLRDESQKEPYKFQDFNLDGRIKVAMQFLDHRDIDYSVAKGDMEFFLKNREYRDQDRVPSILIDAIFGSKSELLNNVEKKGIGFESVSDLTIDQKRVWVKGDDNPMIEYGKNRKGKEQFGKMVDNSLDRDGRVREALLATIENTEVHRGVGRSPSSIPGVHSVSPRGGSKGT